MDNLCFNLEMTPLPRGYTPLECVSIVKCLDREGEPTILIRSTEGIMAWEAVGMLITGSDSGRLDLQRDLGSLPNGRDSDEDRD
jgi:hypothetical protein